MKAVCVAVVFATAVQLPLGHAADPPVAPAPRDSPQPDPKPKTGVEVRIVSANDRYRTDDDLPIIVRLGSDGTFWGIDGDILGKSPSKLLDPSVEDRKSGRPASLVVRLANEKETSLTVVIEALNRLRKTAPADARAIIYVELSNLDQLQPEKK
jgi:hypothetical protein